MIEKQCATAIRDRALKAITELTQVLNLDLSQCSQEEFEQIKRGVGLSIGKIQSELLDVICAHYPELNDLT